MRSEIETFDQKQPSFIEQARRAQIIECAIDTIAELGFAQASLAQIAKRAGVSTGVISYYFAGKDDLIRAVATHVFATGEAEIRPKVEGQSDARTALLAFVVANVAFIAQRPNYGLAMMNIARSGQTDAGALRYDPGVDAPRRMGFREILEWGQRDGQFRTFPVSVMTETIIEALGAIPRQWAADPGLDLNAYAEELAELFDRAVRADVTPAKEAVIP